MSVLSLSHTEFNTTLQTFIDDLEQEVLTIGSTINSVSPGNPPCVYNAHSLIPILLKAMTA